MRHVQSVKLRKKAKKRPNIPKNPIFSMNLGPSIWFLKSGRIRVQGETLSFQLTRVIKEVPTFKIVLLSFDFIGIQQDRQEARIGNKPIENRI